MARYGGGRMLRRQAYEVLEAGAGAQPGIPVRRYGTVPPPPAALRPWNDASPRRGPGGFVRGAAALLLAALCAAGALLLTR